MKHAIKVNTSPSRNVLIAEHADMARRIALKIARRTPSWVSADDLVSAAMVGLAEAAERYDAERGEPFVAFAAKRVRGEVLDELRRGDRLSRRNRVSVKKLRECIHALEHKLGRAPDEQEIAAEAGIELAECRELLCAINATATTYDSALAADLATEAGSPLSVVEQAQLRAHLVAALKELDERDARLLALYYDEEMTYAQIGGALGITESRVCQLHARALARLRLFFGSGAVVAAPVRKPAARVAAPARRPAARAVAVG